jgi:tripartite ATP-independent transporter DctM subunit
MLTFAIFVVLVVLLIVDIPIAIAIGLTAIVFFVAQGHTEFLAMLPQRMYFGSTGFALLAIPFFILAGNLMNTGGTTERLFRFARALVGHVSGGVGQVSIVSAMIMSGISGSAVADAAGIGRVQHTAMVRSGYPAHVSAAIVAAASTIGPVIPPSIPFVLYGSITNESVARLFLAGCVPGLFMGAAMMFTVYLMAGPRRLPREARASWRELWESGKAAFLPLMTPVFIIGGMTTGFFTPTEAAVIASLYALGLGFLYRDLHLKDLPDVLFATIRQTCGLMFIMATATFFGWFVIFERIPDDLINQLMVFGTTPGSFLWLTIAVILLLGCFIDGNSIFLITLPIFMKICPLFQVDMVNFGVVMTLLVMIGNLTPPVGMCLFAVDSFANVGIRKLGFEVLPYLVAILVVTVCCAFVPGIALTLPNWLMGPNV